METKEAVVRKFLDQNSVPVFRQAYSLAISAHKNHLRQDKSPYFGHPNEIVYLMTRMGIEGEADLSAAILHDAIEEGGATAEEIRSATNGEVARLVVALTKTKGMSKEEMKEYFATIELDPRLILIKTLDRFVNMRRSMYGVYNSERMRRYVQETEEHILPMSERFITRCQDNGCEVWEDKYVRALQIVRSAIKGILLGAKAHIELKEGGRQE